MIKVNNGVQSSTRTMPPQCTNDEKCVCGFCRPDADLNRDISRDDQRVTNDHNDQNDDNFMDSDRREALNLETREGEPTRTTSPNYQVPRFSSGVGGTLPTLGCFSGLLNNPLPMPGSLHTLQYPQSTQQLQQLAMLHQGYLASLNLLNTQLFLQNQGFLQGSPLTGVAPRPPHSMQLQLQQIAQAAPKLQKAQQQQQQNQNQHNTSILPNTQLPQTQSTPNNSQIPASFLTPSTSSSGGFASQHLKTPSRLLKPSLEGTTDLEERDVIAKNSQLLPHQFAETFKQRRIKLGFTQADVGSGMEKFHGNDFSQTTISKFEAQKLSYKNMLKLQPLLQEWLEDAEKRLSNPESPSNPITTPETIGKRRKRRTFIKPTVSVALENAFLQNPKPTSEDISVLANRLRMEKEVVRMWFCNRRRRRRQSTPPLLKWARLALRQMQMAQCTP